MKCFQRRRRRPGRRGGRGKEANHWNPVVSESLSCDRVLLHQRVETPEKAIDKFYKVKDTNYVIPRYTVTFLST